MLFFKKPKFISGLLPDPRPEEEKQKDYLTSEILAAQPVEWLDFEEWKKKDEIRKMLEEIPVYDQDGSGSCVSASIALIATINNWKEEGKALKYGFRGIYARRGNKPGFGMNFFDAAELFRKYGLVFESILPSEGLDEEKMNKLDDYLPSFDLVGKIYAPDNYIWVNNVSDIIQVLNLGLPVQIGVKFGDGEWNKEVPQIKYDVSLDKLPYGHSVVIMPSSFFRYRGRLAFLIQDSWSPKSGWNGRRILTEDWLLKRFIGGLWYADRKNLEVFNADLPKPKYRFTRELSVGMRGNDVSMLQVCLATLKDEEGYLFPLWLGQEPTGFYGGITRNAVKRFQKMYGLELEPVGRVGPQTLAKLNEIFG